MGLGITQASLVSAVADKTHDDSSDAIVKIKRVINTVGPDFCSLADFPFLRDDISFAITNAAYKYSGASVLPATFKRILAMHIEDENFERYPINEVSIQTSHEWENPDDFTGIPDELCVTRPESGYWEVQFSNKPDQNLNVYMEIEKQWTDLSNPSDETVITKPFMTAFVHFICMDIFANQGDTESLLTAQTAWWNERNPRSSILGRMLASLKKPTGKKRLAPWPPINNPLLYSKKVNDYARSFE
jgi:hypothetical protein